MNGQTPRFLHAVRAYIVGKIYGLLVTFLQQLNYYVLNKMNVNLKSFKLKVEVELVIKEICTTRHKNGRTMMNIVPLWPIHLLPST